MCSRGGLWSIRLLEVDQQNDGVLKSPPLEEALITLWAKHESQALG